MSKTAGRAQRSQITVSRAQQGLSGTLEGVSERTIYVNMGVTVEYNDNDYDIYPLSVIASVHASREEAETARIAAARVESQGWQPHEISPGCMKDAETVEEAVLRHIAVCEAQVSLQDEESGEQLYALLAPSGAEANEWGPSWTGPKCWGVCRREVTVELAESVTRTLREASQAVTRAEGEGSWMMQHLSEMMRLHAIEIPERVL